MPFQIFPNATFYWLLSHIVGLSNKLSAFLWSPFIKITQVASLPDFVTWMFDTRNQERELRKIVRGRLLVVLVVRGAPSAPSRKQISNLLNSKLGRNNSPKNHLQQKFHWRLLLSFTTITQMWIRQLREIGFSHLRKASLPSQVGGWSQEQPWRRWARKELSGWRSSREFFSAAWWWTWCQGRVLDSTRRSLRFALQALLKFSRNYILNQ